MGGLSTGEEYEGAMQDVRIYTNSLSERYNCNSPRQHECSANDSYCIIEDHQQPVTMVTAMASY